MSNENQKREFLNGDDELFPTKVCGGFFSDGTPVEIYEQYINEEKENG